MLVLGVETSTPAASVCLATEQGVVASTSLGSGLPHLQRAHGRFVTEAIRWCLQSAELVPDDVKGVAVSLGPGLFTGMRVGAEFRTGRPETLAGELEAIGEDVLCVGDGAIAHAGLLASVGAEIGGVGSAHPTAQALVELALPRFLREETRRPEELTPTYIRQADAQINWAKRGALHGGTAGS